MASIEAVLEQLTRLTRAKAQDQSPVIVAIDGRCGAGKSTLAAVLAERLDANLIHMDDFFLRPEQRTPEYYAKRPCPNLVALAADVLDEFLREKQVI